MFMLRCPGCGKTMKYEARDGIIKNKSKQCVYCGRFFKVGGHIMSKILPGNVSIESVA